MIVRDQLDKRLQYLSDWEREQLGELFSAESKQDWTKYDLVKDNFLSHLEDELIHYFDWRLAPLERTTLRRKFITIVGIWDLIPQQDLKKMVARVDGVRKRPIADRIGNPWSFTGEIKNETEVAAVDLKCLEPFADFLARFEKEEGVSYLDYLSGSREKRIYPYADSLCFCRSLEGLVVPTRYVSASADPFTKTIYISLYNEDGRRRDFISICYELVLENAFLDFYINWPGMFEPYRLLRNMMIIALRFLASVLAWIDKEREHAPDLSWLDPFLPRETFLGNLSLYESYVQNLRDVFMRANLLKLFQLNKQLKLPEDDLGIHF